jgi:hypothetical protein
LGLTGLLPPVISTLEAQVKCAYAQYQRLPDALGKNIYLTALHDRNEVLFYRLLSEHLREMIPIVNDLTVGMAMQQYHHECRRPRGVYLSIDHADAIEEAFAKSGAGPGDIDLILATDAEQIWAWATGAWAASRSRSANWRFIPPPAESIPTRVIPVMLDVGTNRESLLKDPMYIGNRHARVRGEALRRLHRSLRQSRDQAVSERAAAVGRLCAGQRTPHPGEISRTDLHVQRRHAGHGRDHAGGRGFRGARLRIAAAEPARRDLWRRHRGLRHRRSDARCDDEGGLSAEEATARFWLVDRRSADRRHGRPAARLSGNLRPPGEVKPK